MEFTCLCLASFPQHCNSEIHLHLCKRGSDFSLLCGTLLYAHVTYLFYLLEFFGVGGTLDNAAVNILAHIFWWI